MKDFDISLNDLKQLTKWVKESSDIRELSLSYNGLELFISRNENTQRTAPNQASSTPATVESAAINDVKTELNKPASVATESKSSKTPDISVGEDEHLITAPMVGTFYMSPKPGAPAFVEVGQQVEPKSVVCIIEVMKLMNNLEAKVNGRVKEIYVEDQQPVEYGQPIMLIEKE
ncbi:acetyl-CoA carboxylase biotin carboxyl carrier protein [Halovibrio sp. HP20-50]|uniref:acetyl-CoA carboxylase biotin carboxyl carrier protein n=1 Tax=Halovibrio sp. HP20-59 TaxID=3080275 RepID=UPI00294B4E13|nr:acetyl-CoA carboxylase biotin carboxyl carrier protein [Halovibrio sp. HP20-59]MEA2119065.1 acetyl-CoA carboxylase biotin carboxyl carrier protein [Halovibrio sp. HP20-59]